MQDKYTINKIVKRNQFIEITWLDKHISKFHFLWLRDNCPSAIHPTANMRIFNILSVTKNIFPKDININKTKLIICWSEKNHKSNFGIKWLRDHCYSSIKKYVSPYFFWDQKLKETFNKIKINHDKVLNNDNHLQKWLKLLHEYGFAIIKNAPIKKKSAFKILNRISHHRETFFGTPFEVINVPKPNNTAYTADALRNHTDLPYFEYAPGYQFLHCLVNDAKGGNSSVVDGFAVANYLKINEKEAFKVLTNTYVKFKDTDYTQKATRVLHSPLITLNKDKDFNDIRFSMAAMGTVDVDSKKMKSFYEAYYLFAELLHSKKFKIDFRLLSGDIFCFNNRRILHGRTAFDPNSGNRHLQGYYLERDEILARLNYFNKLKV
ncbi:TauD/TfdA family dioxygenase [Pelagibacteraceae bacterium]|nr:TauD/TfdA family dioxygenase [Pelagibacteraceae bacterium]